MINFSVPYFGQLKAPERLTATVKQYGDLLYNLYAARYVWETPAHVPQEIPTEVLSVSKFAAICEDGGFYPAAPVKVPDKYGHFNKWTVTTFDGNVFEVEDGKTAVIIHNTPAEIADREIIGRFAYLLAQTETSMNTALLNSRSTRFFQAETETEKLKLEKAFYENESGAPVVAVMGESNKNDFLDEKRGFEPYEFNDTNEVNRLQYLSQFSDDLLRRFVLQYGIDTCNINKQAQVSTDELHQYEQIAEILYNQTYDIYAAAVEKANNLFEHKYGISKNPLFVHKQETEINESEGAENGLNDIQTEQNENLKNNLSE